MIESGAITQPEVLPMNWQKPFFSAAPVAVVKPRPIPPPKIPKSKPKPAKPAKPEPEPESHE